MSCVEICLILSCFQVENYDNIYFLYINLKEELDNNTMRRNN